jgi:putative selenate reductase
MCTKAYQQVLEALTPVGENQQKKAAIVGGGPAGIAAASISQGQASTLQYLKSEKTLGGIVTWTVPISVLTIMWLKKM